jgi:hypothetical protein
MSKNNALATAASNFAHIRRFIKIAKLLNEASIIPMPLKGLALHIDTYSQSNIRPSCDIDILLGKEEVPICAAVLKKYGYSISKNYAQEIIFGNGKTVFDVHFSLLPWHEEKHVYKISSEDILRRAKEIDFEGCRILMMNKNDLVLYAAVICARDGYRNYMRYADIDAIIKAHKASIDWGYLYIEAKSMQFDKKLNMIFSFLIHNLHTPIPLPENIKMPKRPSRIDLVVGQSQKNFNVFTFFEAPAIKDKMALILIYLKWRCFLRFGLFKDYFGVKICVLDKDIFMRTNKRPTPNV